MKKKISANNIYPSIVTWMGDWKQQLRDAERLKLKHASLFLTGAKKDERRFIFQRLQKTTIKTFPHVHLRDDMTEAEVDFCVKTLKAKVFTTHYPHLKFFQKSKHRKKIFVENNSDGDEVKDLSKLKTIGGVCIDLGHLEEFRKYNFREFVTACRMALEFPVGLNHLSVVKKGGRHWHRATKLSEFEYLKGIPKEFFSEYICLELGNSIAEQLRFKAHIAKLLSL